MLSLDRCISHYCSFVTNFQNYRFVYILVVFTTFYRKLKFSIVNPVLSNYFRGQLLKKSAFHRKSELFVV